MGILKKPLVTEKVSVLNEKSIYGLIVDNKANKIELKKEIERVYGVTVARINTIRYVGKKKHRYTKSRGITTGKKPSYKKAIITLKEGEVIDFYSNI